MTRMKISFPRLYTSTAYGTAFHWSLASRLRIIYVQYRETRRTGLSSRSPFKD